MSLVDFLHSLSFLMLSLLVLLTVSTVAQNYRNVSLGSSLTATGNNSSWPSPSGEFAFGFHPLENKELFLLAIWFDNIPNKTIVWYADGIQSVQRGSKVELTTDSKLVLTDPQGNEVWNADKATPITGTVSHAAMLDNGNFVIIGRDSVKLWESFKNPTDTILPTQIMEVDGVVYSRQAENNYSKGRFRLRLLQDGNLVLNIVDFPSLTEIQYDAYYHSNTVDTNKSNAGYQLVFSEKGDIYVVRRNRNIEYLSWRNTDLKSDLYYRATLDPDGMFVQYSHPKNSSGNQTWSIERLIPKDICSKIGGRLGSGACGYNSYCVLTTKRRPACRCPEAYSLVDPSNTFAGCKPNFIQGCQEGDESKNPEDVFELQFLRNVDWPNSDYESMMSDSDQACISSCMNDCQCSVAIRKDATCWKKRLPLSNGRLNRNWSGQTFIKVRKDDLTTKQNCSFSCKDEKDLVPVPETKKERKDRSTLILVGSILLGSSIFLNLTFLSTKFVVFYFTDNKELRKANQDPSVVGTNLRSFTYKDLEEATDGFKQELGRGAFGIVYKGLVEEMESRNHIAVKKLDKVINKGEKEFKTEVSVIGQTHHKNLVRLHGFCQEGQQRLLVYEFMTNGSLADYLFRNPKPEWNQRTQIALGIARGLTYLHEECSTQIIHCDIKPQNILLDDCFTPRISDFGLAKLLMSDQTRTLTSIRGTRGYVAPEWFRNTQITLKVDVYSFGVVLLEIICCRKNVQMEFEEEEKAVLTDWAYDCYSARNLEDLVENDMDAFNDMRRLERLVMIAIWCIQEEPPHRPSMKRVTQMLEGVLDVPVPPCPYPCNTVTGNHSQLL